MPRASPGQSHIEPRARAGRTRRSASARRCRPSPPFTVDGTSHDACTLLHAEAWVWGPVAWLTSTLKVRPESPVGIRVRLVRAEEGRTRSPRQLQLDSGARACLLDDGLDLLLNGVGGRPEEERESPAVAGAHAVGAATPAGVIKDPACLRRGRTPSVCSMTRKTGGPTSGTDRESHVNELAARIAFLMTSAGSLVQTNGVGMFVPVGDVMLDVLDRGRGRSRRTPAAPTCG